MKIYQHILTALLPPLYRLWSWSLRYEEIGREALDALDARGECAVLCLWHGEIFGLWHTKRQLRTLAMISRSRDGEFLARVVAKLGFNLARGSSSRGGSSALHAAVRAMRAYRQSPCVALDGPRGPFHRVKDGAFFLAHHGDAWIMPVRAFYSRSVRFSSWDGSYLPIPFSRVRVVYAPPYRLEAAELNEDVLQRERARLQEKMDALDSRAYPARRG
jgi:lysophospholipid acyltransferase (LPLAT)-like uncharacterized protein